MTRPTRFAILALLLGLSACAPRGTLRWAPGLALARPGSAPAPLPAARTIRAETRCVLKSQGRTMRFETVLVADSTSGRLEAVGPFGMNLATIVWRDSTWEVYLPAQGALVRGTGDSLTLPVVGMRTIRPKELLGPYVGRPIPARSGVPLRTVGGDEKQVVVMPVERFPRWSLVLDRSTGLPRRLQVLRDAREAERIDFGAWKDREGVPVPDSMVRTGAAGQELTMILEEWRLEPFLDPRLLAFDFPKPVDTILVETDGAGRPRYRLSRPTPGASGMSDGDADSLLGGDSGEGSVDEGTIEDEAPPEGEDPSLQEPGADLPDAEEADPEHPAAPVGEEP